jgi:hypothetical protein
MRKNLCEKCCVGTVIYSDKCGKTAVRETVDAEINNVIYVELYSGAKMAYSKYRKMYFAGSIDRENTVLVRMLSILVWLFHTGVSPCQYFFFIDEHNPCGCIIQLKFIFFARGFSFLLGFYDEGGVQEGC